MTHMAYLARPDGERIAYRARPGKGPGVLWLSGFKSDMEGTKAVSLDAWAARQGQGYVRFDYLGHGASSGSFTSGTIGRWIDDAAAVLDELTTGPQVLVGSSMGGWIALHLALRRPERIAGLVLIAPAPDFTEDLLFAEMPAEGRAALASEGVWHRPTEYGPDPYPITRHLIEEGRRHLLLRAPIDVRVPVHILHGMQDRDVPFARSLRLVDRLASQDVIAEFSKSGDHRLSTAADLERLEEAVETMTRRGVGGA